MITLTESAIKKALEVRNAGGSTQALRIAVRGGGCSGFTYDLFFDDAKDSDIKLEFGELTVVTDQMSMMYLDETKVDYLEIDLFNSGFKIESSNVKSTCGCGKSIEFK